MSRPLAAVVGGAAGAVALVGIVGLLMWFCLFHKRGVSRKSETVSSDSSVQGNIYFMRRPLRTTSTMQQIIGFVFICFFLLGKHLGVELSVSLREARRFQLEELSLATKNFNDRNLIGEGKFGEVYKGLLQDGMLVAIKKRSGAPSQEFIDEVITTPASYQR